MSAITSTRPRQLRSSNKQRVHNALAQAAINLAIARGSTDFTVDEIVEEVGVARATFFRYFETKEAAIVVAFYEKRLKEWVETLTAAPAALGPVDTLIWGFQKQVVESTQRGQWLRALATIHDASPALRAKALDYQASYDQAIAAAIAPRFGKLAADDLRPQLLAAAARAIVSTCMQRWSAGHVSGNVVELVSSALQHLNVGFSASVTADSGAPSGVTVAKRKRSAK